jgi:hypothetical protein
MLIFRKCIDQPHSISGKSGTSKCPNARLWNQVSAAFVFLDGIVDKGTEELKRSAASPKNKGNQSCRVVSLLLHPLSLASGALLLFQLTPPHILEEVLALVALAFIVVAFIVVQRYAVEWR